MNDFGSQESSQVTSKTKPHTRNAAPGKQVQYGGRRTQASGENTESCTSHESEEDHHTSNSITSSEAKSGTTRTTAKTNARSKSGADVTSHRKSGGRKDESSDKHRKGAKRSAGNEKDHPNNSSIISESATSKKQTEAVGGKVRSKQVGGFSDKPVTRKGDKGSLGRGKGDERRK